MSTETANRTKTQVILEIMRVMAWVAAIGLLVQTGTILVSHAVLYMYPDAATKMDKSLELYDLRGLDLWQYCIAVLSLASLPAAKAQIAFLFIKVLSAVNLSNPFSMGVVKTLERISHVSLGAAISGVLYNAYAEWLLHKTRVSMHEWPVGDLLIVAGMVFIISQVFKRGVELQTENDLTV